MADLVALQIQFFQAMGYGSKIWHLHQHIIIQIYDTETLEDGEINNVPGLQRYIMLTSGVQIMKKGSNLRDWRWQSLGETGLLY